MLDLGCGFRLTYRQPAGFDGEDFAVFEPDR